MVPCMSYLFIDHELGDGEDIDRLTVPHGMFTSRICGIRCTEFSRFCMERSIEISPFATDFSRRGCSRRSQPGFQKI